MPGAVTLSVAVLDHASIPGSIKISMPDSLSRIRDLLHQSQWKISDRRRLDRDGLLLPLREILDSLRQIQVERRHSNPPGLGVVRLTAQPLHQGCCSGLAERGKGGENLGLGGVLVHQNCDVPRPTLVTVDEQALQRLNIVHCSFEPRWTALTTESALTSLIIHANQHRMPFGPPNDHQPQEYREPYPQAIPRRPILPSFPRSGCIPCHLLRLSCTRLPVWRSWRDRDSPVCSVLRSVCQASSVRRWSIGCLNSYQLKRAPRGSVGPGAWPLA
jgi:hypothetical protein